MGNTPGDWQIQPPPPPRAALLARLQVRSTWSEHANTFLEDGWCRSPDEGVHISAKYGQLIAHLIKERVIKIGQANG